jgi:hypothetical protein
MGIKKHAKKTEDLTVDTNFSKVRHSFFWRFALKLSGINFNVKALTFSALLRFLHQFNLRI